MDHLGGISRVSWLDIRPFGRNGGTLRLHHHLDTAIFFFLEHLVSGRRFCQREGMRDNKRWIDLSVLDHLEQWLQVAMDVCLSHFEGQALVERRAHRDRHGNGRNQTGHRSLEKSAK